MRKSRIRILSDFKKYLYGLKWPIGVMLVGSLCSIPLAMLSPKLYQLFIDRVLGEKQISLFGYIAIALVAVFLVQLANDAIQVKNTQTLQNRFSYALRCDIWNKYFNVPYTSYQKVQINEWKMRISEDVDKVSGFVKEQIADYMTGILTVVVTLIVCAAISYQYLLICLPILPVVLTVDYFISKGTQKINAEIRKTNEVYGAFEHDTLKMWKEVKIQCAEKTFIERYKEFRKQLSKLGLVQIRYWLYREVFNDFKSNYLTKVLVYIIGVFLVIRGDISVGTVIMFGSYHEMLFNAVDSVNKSRMSFKANMPYYERIHHTLTLEEEHNEEKCLPESIFPVEFRNVCFSYDGQHKVVEKVSFSICEGDKISMAGESGIGKTTTMQLALGLIEPNSGEIRYGGIPLDGINKEALYRRISAVMQDGYVFNMSIKENLLVSVQDTTDKAITEKAMIRACQMAGIYEFIDSLPQKFDTVVGEGGIKLSGGQRQRLMIARALMKKPEMIYLDEATSALDERVENLIVDNLSNGQYTGTVFAISHKPSMQNKFERIMVMEHESVHEKIHSEGALQTHG